MYLQQGKRGERGSARLPQFRDAMRRSPRALAGARLLLCGRTDRRGERVGHRRDRAWRERIVIGDPLGIAFSRLWTLAGLFFFDDSPGAVPMLLVAAVRLAILEPKLIGAHPYALFAIGLAVNGHANLLLATGGKPLL